MSQALRLCELDFVLPLLLCSVPPAPPAASMPSALDGRCLVTVGPGEPPASQSALGILGVTAPGHGVVSLFLAGSPPAQRGDRDLVLVHYAAAMMAVSGSQMKNYTVCGDASGDHAEPHQLPEAVPLRPWAHGPAAGALRSPTGGRGL